MQSFRVTLALGWLMATMPSLAQGQLAVALTLLWVMPLKPAELRGETKGNVCMVEGQLDTKTKVLVRIESTPGRPIPEKVQEEMDQDPAWRRGRYRNWSQVDRVLIEVNGKPVVIPDSAFEDIYGVQFILVTRYHGAIRIQVTGGDAGAAYDAFFTLAASNREKGRYQVAGKKWQLGEFWDEVWEKTTYHNTVWDDPDM